MNGTNGNGRQQSYTYQVGGVKKMVNTSPFINNQQSINAVIADTKEPEVLD